MRTPSALSNSLETKGKTLLARLPGWIVRASRAGFMATTLGIGTAACVVETSDQGVDVDVTTGTAAPSIFGGAKDDDRASAAGVVALRVGTGSKFVLCTGALVAPNLVLTARHCLTEKMAASVACDEYGRSTSGDQIIADRDPREIGIYLGATPDFAAPPVARGSAIVAPQGKNLCDGDIALMVLREPVKGVQTLPLRIHASVLAGEKIRSAGYGHNDQTEALGTRFRKDGVAVLAQGRAISPSNTPLGAHEFEVGVSTCQGDSGGPAISEVTGAVVGVVSRGGDCSEDFGHIYTTTSGFDSLFEQAFAMANAAPTLEPGDAEARVLPSSQTSEGNANGGGCSVGTRSGKPTAAGGILALVLAAGSARRKRRRCSH